MTNNLETIHIDAIEIEDLAFQFEKLSNLSAKNNLSLNQKLIIEKHKVAVIGRIANHINYTAKQQKIMPIPPVEKNNKYKQLGLWFVLSILIAFDFAPMIIGGLMYAQESLSTLLPYLPLIIATPHVMTVLGLGCVLSGIFGSICFVAPVLIERLGITSPKNNASIESCYHEQINGIEQINKSLLSYNDLTSTETWSYIKVAKLLNKNMELLKENYKEADRGFLSRTFSWIITCLMAIQCVAGSLFMASGLIGWLIGSTLAATALIPTMPVVTAVVAIAFFIPQLLTTYILRTRSADEFIGQGVKSHDELKNKIRDFNVIQDIAFDKIHNEKLANEINACKLHAKKPDFINEIKDYNNQIERKVSLGNSSIYQFWKPSNLIRGDEFKHEISHHLSFKQKIA